MGGSEHWTGRASGDGTGALPQQKELAGLLEQVGRTLYRRDRADPLLTMETSLLALHAISTWLEARTVQQAMQEVGREQVEEWAAELRAGVVHLETLQQLVQEELQLSLRERNRRRRDLAPGTH